MYGWEPEYVRFEDITHKQGIIGSDSWSVYTLATEIPTLLYPS